MRKRSLLYQECQSFGRVFIQPLCNSYGSVVKKGLSHLRGTRGRIGERGHLSWLLDLSLLSVSVEGHHHLSPVRVGQDAACEGRELPRARSPAILP